jgi:uncharacterized protein YjdB
VQPATVSVTGVSLNVGNRSLEVGQMFQLTETITPSNATNKAVSWSSSNGNVASVSTAGLVTAKVVGTATITVTTVNGNKTATCVITVQPATVSVTGVSLNVGNRSLEVGQTFQLTETITPSNATNKAVSWSSSNGNVASVSTAGLITAKVAGTATITVTTVNGNKTATCAITVQPANVPVTGVSLNVGNPSLEVGQTFQLTEAITPSNATNKAVSWSSSNGSIASVSTSGLVTANAAGTATITVTTADGNRTAACTVTVTTTLIGGTTGPLTWTFDTNTGKLTISGNGAMPDYGSNGYDAPWYSYRNNIQSIIMNEGVTVISSGAFNGCNISSITIPGSVTAIGSSAFSNCRYLSSITIPANVTSIGTGGFRGQGLTEIHVSVSNQAYTSEDGVLFNKAKTSLLQYPENKSNANYTIPSTVSYIGQIAFFGNHHLTSVSISNSVTGFGNQSFDYMSGLSTVKVGWNPPISYPHGVFQNGVDNNGIYVNDIGAMTLVVPAGTKPLYEAAPGWKDFGTIVEDASLTSGEGNSVNIIEPETIASSDIQVYVSNNRLYISSPSAEQIGVYSVDGALVYSGWKNAGVVTFDIHHLPTGMFIARGSSGWVRKGIILYK